MKISLNKIFLAQVFALVFISLGDVYGQESGSPSFERYDVDPSAAPERIIRSNEAATEASKISPFPSQSDSISRFPQHNAVKPAAPAQPKQPTKSKEEDDSILSFNFLYYLIERYKLQDIVD